MRALLAFFVLMGVTSNAFGQATPTISDRYLWLEKDTEKRTDFIKAQGEAVDSKAQADANYKNIEFWLFQTYDVQTTTTQVTIDSTHSVSLIERGLGKPTEIVLDSPTGEKVLFSNDESLKSPTRNVIDMGVSPDKKALYAVVEEDGSIDQVVLRVYDIAHDKLLPAHLGAAENSVAWISNTEFFYPTGDTTSAVFDITTGKSTNNKMYLVADGPGYYILADGTNTTLHNKSNKTVITIDNTVVPAAILGSNGDSIYIQTVGAKGLGEIRTFSASGAAKQTGTVLVAESDKYITDASLDTKYFIVNTRAGADRLSTIYDLNGVQVGALAVPNCASMTLSWAVPGEILKAKLTSAVMTGVIINYDLRNNTWDRDPATMLMSVDGVDYSTEIVTATSKDGTKIPVRITHRADLQADGTHPALFESYGGFEIGGYIDPSFTRAYTEYMKRGGILAGPALRGGNEYGPTWHDQATGKNKVKTFDDLAASASLLVQLGWTQPHLIISTGTSNGGLTVAATALLNPTLFGLVIPISGDHDLIGKDRMDAKNGGWDDEYGSASDAAMRPILMAESPIENAKNLGQMHFLILDGLDDTRVNFANSLKLGAALEDLGGAKGQVELASFDRAGHWLASFYYQNSIAWHANVLFWVQIYDLAGWKF